MDLREILDESIIDLNLEGSNKDEALYNLSNRLYQFGYINDIDQFISDIYKREEEGATGMGHGISIPHGKSKAVQRNGIAIGRCLRDIRWESSMSVDGFQKTRLIFLFCVSDDQNFSKTHMMLLAELAGKLGNDARVNKLNRVKSKTELIDTIVYDSESIVENSSEETIEELDIQVIDS